MARVIWTITYDDEQPSDTIEASLIGAGTDHVNPIRLFELIGAIPGLVLPRPPASPSAPRLTEEVVR